MKRANFLLFFYTLCLIVFSSTAATTPTTANSDDIREEVEEFLRKKVNKQLPKNQHAGVNITVRSLDQNLRLPRCDKSLTLKLQGQRIQRSTSVKVSCRGSKPWSIYISSIISLEMPVITLSRNLPRRHIITAADLTTTIRDTYALRSGYTTEASNIVGQELKRPLKSGDVVYSFHLQAPDIIKKGDRVTVLAKRGGLSVMSHGIALSDASKGEKVRVENQRSSRIIQALVTGPGTVEVL